MKLFKSFLFFVALSSSCLLHGTDPNWSLLVYMEAPDLHDAALLNFTQLLQAHTSNNADICIQLHLPGTQAWRYRVRQGALVFEDTVDVSLDYERDVVDACRWAYSNWAKYHALILWGHGCGVLQPTWDEQKGDWQVEHDASQDSCIDCTRSGLTQQVLRQHRGVLLNSKTRDYLTNENMVAVTKAVAEDVLHKKLDILGFDCCLGAMFEHAYQVAPHVRYLIGCQNCELPDGFNYVGLGKRISESWCTPRDLVDGIVKDYGVYYRQHAPQGLYTLAGFDCSKVTRVKELLDMFVALLVPELQNNPEGTRALKGAIAENSIRFCWMPMYTDLHMLVTIVEQELKGEQWSDMPEETYIVLRTLIGTLKTEIKDAVVNNVTGHRMHKAHGISIYLPFSHIDSSYYKTPFAQNSVWLQFLNMFTEEQ